MSPSLRTWTLDRLRLCRSSLLDRLPTTPVSHPLPLSGASSGQTPALHYTTVTATVTVKPTSTMELVYSKGLVVNQHFHHTTLVAWPTLCALLSEIASSDQWEWKLLALTSEKPLLNQTKICWPSHVLCLYGLTVTLPKCWSSPRVVCGKYSPWKIPYIRVLPWKKWEGLDFSLLG